jgi:large subunit ribosomal protein L29
MDIEKIRNLGDEELHAQEHDAADQLFRLRFQLKMGQTESITKMRTLRKDIARIKTVMRQRELGQSAPASAAAPKKTKAAPAETAAKTSAKAAKPAAKKTAAKKAAKPVAKKAAKKKPEKK